MTELTELAERVLSNQVPQESHWLEWKSIADLSQKIWQARSARFILGAANKGPSACDLLT